MQPLSTAFLPRRSARLTLAPAASSSSTTSARRLSTARIKAVLPRVGTIDGRTGRKQAPGNGKVAARRGAHERRVTLDIGPIDVGARLDQTIDDRIVTAPDRAAERRPAIAVGNVGVGAGGEERADVGRRCRRGQP